eukprot:403343767
MDQQLQGFKYYENSLNLSLQQSLAQQSSFNSTINSVNLQSDVKDLNQTQFITISKQKHQSRRQAQTQPTSPINLKTINPQKQLLYQNISSRIDNQREQVKLKFKMSKQDEKEQLNLILYDRNAGKQIKLNNLYGINAKIEEEIKRANNKEKKTIITNEGEHQDFEGPMSNINFDRFNQNMKADQRCLGIRRVAQKINEIKEVQMVDSEFKIQEEKEMFKNPLITHEKLFIIEAAQPEQNMQQLLGLDKKQFLEFRKTEKWVQKRTTSNDYTSKEKHVEFAKELFCLWDDDNSGVLDLHEIALPLISLGLSTNTQFVAKLLQSLLENPNRLKNGSQQHNDIQITLKDFVKIFNVDKVGEKMSLVVKQSIIDKKIQEHKEKLQHFQSQIRNNRTRQNSPTFSNTVFTQHQQTIQHQQYSRIISPNKGSNLSIGLFDSRLNNQESMISLGAISADLPQMQPQSSKMPQINERSSLLGSKLSNNPYMNYSILYKPSLSELMDELELWWKEIDPLQRFEADIEKVLLLLVKKGISQDLDGSLKIIQKYLGKQIGKTSQKTLTLEDFKRLFCRCFFKDSLIQLSQDIEKIKSLDQSAPLSLKLGLYQRQLMMDGIEKEGIENQHGRHIMNALSLIKTQQEEDLEGGDSYIRHDKYEDFVQDPFGKLAKELKERELRKNRQDDYIKSIKLARMSQSTSTTIQNALKGKFGKISGDLDKIIVQNQEVEEVIGDRNNMENFLFKVQKQKQQDIIQQENKMRKIHNANEVNHNQRQRNHNKVSIHHISKTMSKLDFLIIFEQIIPLKIQEKTRHQIIKLEKQTFLICINSQQILQQHSQLKIIITCLT